MEVFAVRRKWKRDNSIVYVIEYVPKGLYLTSNGIYRLATLEDISPNWEFKYELEAELVIKALRMTPKERAEILNCIAFDVAEAENDANKDMEPLLTKIKSYYLKIKR